MKRVEVSDAAGQLDALLAEAGAGEDVVLTRAGCDVGRIVSCGSRPGSADAMDAAAAIVALGESIAARGVFLSQEQIKADIEDGRM